MPRGTSAGSWYRGSHRIRRERRKLRTLPHSESCIRWVRAMAAATPMSARMTFPLWSIRMLPACEDAQTRLLMRLSIQFDCPV